jgi:predicted permease
MEPSKERTRREIRSARLERISRDLHYARRALTRAPGFTAVAVITLALGIGATTAMFSVVNAVVLRPLPYPEQDRLVEVVHTSPVVKELLASPAIYFGYRDHSQAFDAVGLWNWDASPVTVTGAGETESVPSVQVTHEVLTVLGATSVHGRLFGVADDAAGAPRTVVISHGYEQRHFGGTGSVGRTLTVAGIPRQVIGVLAPDFHFFDYNADLYYPLQLDRASARFPGFAGRGIARLKRGVTLAQANADAARVIPLINEEFGRGGRSGQPFRIAPTFRPLKTSIVGEIGTTLWILLGTVGALLLIACANIANLVLVRAQARRGELVIRAALGAGWTDLTGVLLAESVLLGAFGGVAGIAVAYFSLPLLVRLGGDDLPSLMTVTIDPIVLLVAVGTTLLTTAVFALVPLGQLEASRLHLAATLRGSRAAGGTRQANRTRHALVIAQVAVALVLLVGAGLMIRTFVTLRGIDPGFRSPSAVLTFLITLPQTEPSTGITPAAARERTLTTHRTIAERLAGVAGVDSVGFASGNDPLPLDGDGSLVSILPFIDGKQPEDTLARTWESQRVAPGFFETMQTAIVAGRGIEWRDIDQRRAVMLVSESVARREWGSSAAALGHRISPAPNQEGSEIIGVFRDVRHNGVHQPAPEGVALPVAPGETATFVLRSSRVGTPTFVNDLQKAVQTINPGLSLAKARTLDDLYRHSMARTSMTLSLLVITGVMALTLGLIGIYGMVSFAASQRRNEIGLRLALGARHGDIRRMFVRYALVLVGIGATIGLGAASVLAQVIESQLFGVTPLDLATNAVVTAAFVVAAVAASYVSAWRGTALDPMVVLRGE